MKKTASVILLAGAVFSVLSLFSCKSVPPEDIKKSIELIEIQTKWISKYYQPWPPRLILVPAISFRVKNAGSVPLKHVSFNAIFKFKGDPENLGDSFLAAIRGNAVNPGEASDVITMNSNFGVEGKNLNSFKDNIQWKPTDVKIFARLEGSQFVLIGEYDVSRDIDFKEPEPIEPRKEAETKTR